LAKKSTLLLIRHGATAANVRRPYILQGLRPDGELIELGRNQSRALARALSPYAVSAVYASPLRRAHETAQFVADAIGLRVDLNPALVEADFGAWSGRTWPEVERLWPEPCHAFRADPARFGYPGGETLTQVLQWAARHAGGTFVVVAHGTVNRVLLAHWLGLPLRDARTIAQDNAAFNVVDFHDGHAEVRTVNAAAHLAEAPAHAA
jgi:broad specificity phosphatase PhoE